MVVGLTSVQWCFCADVPEPDCCVTRATGQAPSQGLRSMVYGGGKVEGRVCTNGRVREVKGRTHINVPSIGAEAHSNDCFCMTCQ